MQNLSNEQIEKAFNKPRHDNGGGLREEIAGLAKGNPLAYDSYMKKTRFEMWLIALGG